MVRSFVWRDVSGTVGGGRSDGRWTVVSSDKYTIRAVTPSGETSMAEIHAFKALGWTKWRDEARSTTSR